MEYAPPIGHEAQGEAAIYIDGNPEAGIEGSAVPAKAFEPGMRELIHLIRFAGLTPSGTDLEQVRKAISMLIESAAPGLATLLANGICHPDGVTLKIDDTGKLSLVEVSKYELGEFYLFRHPTLKAGMQPAQGGVIANAVTLYPQIWEYLQTSEGKKLCKTEAEWQELSTHKYYTLADGTPVGFNGIGGVPFYVQDLNAGTLRLFDMRGTYAEPAGSDSLPVGGVSIDTIRDIVGTAAQSSGSYAYGLVYSNTAVVSGAMYVGPAAGGRPFGDTTQPGSALGFRAGRVVPTGAANAPKNWKGLGCCFLGHPAP